MFYITVPAKGASLRSQDFLFRLNFHFKVKQKACKVPQQDNLENWGFCVSGWKDWCAQNWSHMKSSCGKVFLLPVLSSTSDTSSSNPLSGCDITRKLEEIYPLGSKTATEGFMLQCCQQYSTTYSWSCIWSYLEPERRKVLIITTLLWFGY